MTNQDMWTEAALGELEIVPEDVPTVHRTPPPGRTAFDWGSALAPLMEPENVGKSFRILSYDGSEKGKNQAQAKAQSIRNSLYTNYSHLDFLLQTRERDGEWRVYATYRGRLSDEQQAVRDKLRAERAARIRAGRAGD